MEVGMMNAVLLDGIDVKIVSRKAKRTDYVYVASVHFAGSVTNFDVTRTLTGARKSVKDFSGAKRMPMRNIGQNAWLSDGETDFAGRQTFYSIQRKPLHK